MHVVGHCENKMLWGISLIQQDVPTVLTLLLKIKGAWGKMTLICLMLIFY